VDTLEVAVTDVAIALMILPWAAVVALVYRVRQRGVRDALEDGREPLYQEVCGGAFGKVRRSSPFVRIALYDEFLVIGYSRRLILRYDEIESLSVDGARSPRAVRLHHDRHDLPAEVAIWSPDCYALHERIAAQRRSALDPLR